MLGLDSLPFERDYGCFWADRFRSEARVISNYGSPGGGNETYGYDGLTLDGVANTWVDYDVSHKFLHDSMTIVCEFTPYFNYDEDAGRYLFDSDTDGAATQRITAIKDNLNYNYDFYFCMGGGLLTVSTASYASLWRQNQRNILILKGTAGAGIAVYLNGTQIGSNGTGYAGRTFTNLRIGAKEDSGIYRFNGTIHSLKVYNVEITDEDAQAISSNLVYNPLSSAMAYWPMGSTSLLTDIIGGYNLTATGSPTKLTAGRGYYLDGSSDYFTASGLQIATGSFTVAFLFGMDAHDGFAATHYYNDTHHTIFSTGAYDGNFGGVQARCANYGDFYGHIGKVQDSAQTFTFTGQKPFPGEHFVGLSWDGTSGFAVYDNIVVGPTVVAYANTTNPLQIGHNYLNAVNSLHRGDIYQGAVWSTALTPIQMLRAKWDFKRTRHLAA